MLVVLDFQRDAARDGARQPVRGHASTRQLGHLYRHSDAAEAVGHACDGGGNHLGVGVGVTTHFVLAAIHFAAKHGALQQYVF
jgi:hypothetical protein